MYVHFIVSPLLADDTQCSCSDILVVLIDPSSLPTVYSFVASNILFKITIVMSILTWNGDPD